MTGPAQGALHSARPVLFLALDQGLEFAQMVGVAQGVQHAVHGVVGLSVIVNHDAGDALQQAAAHG